MSLLKHRSSSTHDDSHLGPEELAELEALDAALAGESITDEALARLVRDVRAAAPQMRPEPTQQLNAGVARGFGKGAAPRRTLRLPIHGPAGVAATLFVVVALTGGTVAALSGRDDSTTVTDMSSASDINQRSNGFQPDVEGGRGEAAASATSSAATDSAASSTAESPAATESRSTSAAGKTADSDRTTGRSVERTVDLGVRVKTGKLQEAASRVTGITREANGYIASSDLSLGSKGAGTATFQLRVSSSSLDRAIDRLSALGTVTAQQESSRDITSAVDSAKTRLADARRERTALLAALGKATTAGEIAALRVRIAENRTQIAALDTALQQVQRRADLTTIALTIDAPAKGDPVDDDGSWSIGDAFGDAGSVLATVAGALLVGAAFVAPFALLAALGWGGWAWRRRRLRERALDA